MSKTFCNEPYNYRGSEAICSDDKHLDPLETLIPHRQCPYCESKDAPEPTLFEVIDVRGIPFILFEDETLINLNEIVGLGLKGSELVLVHTVQDVETTLRFNDEVEAKSAFNKLTGKTDQPPLLNQLKANIAKNHAHEQAQAENI